MTNTQKILLVIAGPTAVGKTALAIRLAKHFKTEILSGDSRQFYRELTTGTAKPSEKELASVPHHFINSLSIQQDYNAGDFEKDALALLDQLFIQHELLILCGGSGLFIKALCEGLDELPWEEGVREDIIAQYQKEGLPWLQQELLRLDPEYAVEVDMQNPNRLMRAIEVCRISGKKYSGLRKGGSSLRPFRIIYTGLDLPREELYDRINLRVDMMMQHGLLKEAESLYPHRELAALKTVGYAELFDYMDGKYSNLETAISKIKQHTRNYAKKQLTWFHKQEGMSWFRPDEDDKIIAEISRQMNNFAGE